MFGVSGYGVTFASTRSHIFARRSYSDFLGGNFKTASRRAGWFSRKFLGAKIFFGDYEFNFAENLPQVELEKLEGRIRQKLEKEPDNIELKSDLISIYCEMMKLDWAQYSRLKAVVEELCDDVIAQALEKLPSLPPHAPREQKPLPIEGASAKEALEEFAKTFPLGEWNWYLVSGTFLGLIREKQFLKNDYDIDIGFNAENFELERFLEALDKSEKFTCRKVDHQESYVFGEEKVVSCEKSLTVLKLVYREKLNIDLFIHHLEDGVRWHGSSFHRWENTEYALKGYQLLGVDVQGPENADLYLSENYGDWRTPVSEFEFTTGTPNLKMVRNFDSVAIFIRRLALLQSAQKVNSIIGVLKASGFVDENNRFRFAGERTK